MSTADTLPSVRPAMAPIPQPRDPELRQLANCISFLAVDAVERAKSGHPGMPMGMADIAAVPATGTCRVSTATTPTKSATLSLPLRRPPISHR